MKHLYRLFLFNFCTTLSAFAQNELPTLYEYYTSDGITSGLSVDHPYFTLNGKNITIYSGAMHYFRIPPQYWQDRLIKLRAAGLNTVETYVPWNLHEPRSGYFDFGSGGTDMENFLDLEGYLYWAKQEDLFVIVRPGPYICAEWEWGGLPSWLLREQGIKLRTSDPVYMGYVRRYFERLLPIVAEYQFTKGGPVIAVQVENEYTFAMDIDKKYLQQLTDLMRDNGIVELLVTSDPAVNGDLGTLPGTLFQTANFGSDPADSFQKLEKMQPNQPLMAMEFYSGWFDHWSEVHHTVDNVTFSLLYEQTLAYPASVNLYMFHGGTNWGFMNGANNGFGLQPTTTSYDYDAPLSEGGDYTSKYYIVKELLQKYNPIKTKTPDVPELTEKQAYSPVAIDAQMSFSDIIKSAPNIQIGPTLSMEELALNDESGQSYGYIVYRLEDLDIAANSVLRISGHVHDTIMVLVDGQLVSKPLSSSEDLNNFGFWRSENSSITLTSTDLVDATLDLVIENWGRINFGNISYQLKGLTVDNRVYLNDEELSRWLIYPLEFKKSWTTHLDHWKSSNGADLQKGPGLYKATLTFETYDYHYYNDTFIDMGEWNKGIVVVNGFVLGRYTFIGPQQTLYLPGPFLRHGDNEIIIFEHFAPASEVKFSNHPIFNTP